MRTIYLVRYRVSSLCTIGIVYADGSMFFSLELPWRDNERNNSCIPTGDYECRFMPKSSSGKYRDVYHVLDVPGRDGILIHNGNIADHTKGCILLGGRAGVLLGQPAVLNSRTAMKNFVRKMNKEPFLLRVFGWTG